MGEITESARTPHVDAAPSIVWTEQKKPRRTSPRVLHCKLACGLDIILREAKTGCFVLYVEGIILLAVPGHGEEYAKRAAIPMLYGALARIKGEVDDLLRAQIDSRNDPTPRTTERARAVLADKTFTRTMRDRMRWIARGNEWSPRGASECRMGRMMHDLNLIVRDGRFFRLTAGRDGLGCEVARLLTEQENARG